MFSSRQKKVVNLLKKKATTTQDAGGNKLLAKGKRHSSNSPSEEGVPKKRAALGDRTNAAHIENEAEKKVKKQVPVTTKAIITDKFTTISITTSNQQKPSLPTLSQSPQGPKCNLPKPGVEELNQRNLLKNQEAEEKEREREEAAKQKDPEIEEVCQKLCYADIDAENKADPHMAPVYAADIFEHYRRREEKFRISSYMGRMGMEINPGMRAILVDWLVEVQENFELNHETLYMAVKLVDLYLMKAAVLLTKDRLQLLGATALFIACKFDERCPPLLDDFIYICDDAYEREDFIAMEQAVLKTVDFDLGFPLSYRFLRRYSKCSRASMETLTLARFILELGLQDYGLLVQFTDSLLAAAAFCLALKMKKAGEWTQTLEHYSSYKESDLAGCLIKLNSMLCAPPNKQLSTVRNKYSHKVFYEVAKIPPLEILKI